MSVSKDPPRPWIWIVIVAAIVITATGAAMSATPPGIPPASIPALKCVYRLLKANAAVLSVDVYAIDGFRSAVEYRFTDSARKIVVADMMVTPDRLFTPYTDQNEAFESSLSSKCDLGPAFDNLYPRPKPRAEWQRIDVATVLLVTP